ncbi:MAG TPA: hypothetical protein PK251_11800 [Candidatus Latescibacteria bacterium]|nr:hypothetical protein [Candidatus Latescibacterota bacterium]HPK75516.1 hypothetical protein [Candidatus Latescibacterota bacterium]
MAISAKTRKMLWGRSACRCSFPGCRLSLVEDETETDDPSIVGDEAHIVAKEPDGARGESDLTPHERDAYLNLILLCKVHHKLVDDQPFKFTVQALHQMKEQHLAWVDQTLARDAAKQEDDETYAEYIDRWVALGGVDTWRSWTSSFFEGGVQRLELEAFDRLGELKTYLFSRIWPGRYPALEAAFDNFCRILNDFLLIYEKHAASDDETMWTEKFYHIHVYDQRLYNELFGEYEYHVALVDDLLLELTRAANAVCAEVRKHILKSFRRQEGVLLVSAGPDLDMVYKTMRPEYKGDGQDDRRYPGLRRFMEVRETRDRHFGCGVNENYLLGNP